AIIVSGVATRASIASSPPACAGAAVPASSDGDEDEGVPAGSLVLLACGVLSARATAVSFAGVRAGATDSRTTVSAGAAVGGAAFEDVVAVGRGAAGTFDDGSDAAERTNTFVSLPPGGCWLVLVVVPGESLRTGARDPSGSESTIGSPGRVCCATPS